MKAPFCNIYFIIPCHKSASTIEASVKSILNQDTKEEFKIILAINGEGAEQEKAYQKVQKLNPEKIILKTLKIASRSLARNVALEYPGNYYAFIDSDVNLKNNWLEEHLAPLKGNPGIAASIARVYPDGDDSLLLLIRQALYHRNDVKTERPNVPLLNSAAFLARSDDFIATCGFNPSYKRVEDTDFFVRMLKSGRPIFYMHKPLACVYWNSSKANYLIKKPFQTGLNMARLKREHGIAPRSFFYEASSKRGYKNALVLTHLLIANGVMKLGLIAASIFKTKQRSYIKTQRKKLTVLDLLQSENYAFIFQNDQGLCINLSGKKSLSLQKKQSRYVMQAFNDTMEQISPEFTKTIAQLIGQGVFVYSGPEDCGQEHCDR